jgi:hypothetical protein
MHHTPESISRGLDRILPFVQKPARYTGGEYNAVVKDWEEIRYKLALVFPDVYDLGMSNLGLAILYDIVNQRSDMLAERAYTPWVDMLDAMRREGLAALFIGDAPSAEPVRRARPLAAVRAVLHERALHA